MLQDWAEGLFTAGMCLPQSSPGKLPVPVLRSVESRSPQPPRAAPQHRLTRSPCSPGSDFSSFCCLHVFKQSQNSMRRFYVLSTIQNGFVGFGRCLVRRNVGVPPMSAGCACCQPGPTAGPAGCTRQRFPIAFCSSVWRMISLWKMSAAFYIFFPFPHSS